MLLTHVQMQQDGQLSMAHRHVLREPSLWRVCDA